MSIDHVFLILVDLDLLLTETTKTKERVRQNAQHQIGNLHKRFSDYQDGEYYLSDGGYSRIWMDPFKGRVFLTANSTTKVKDRWDLPEVQKLVSDLKAHMEPEEGFYAKEHHHGNE